ncbi:ATP-binding protein [Asticcacaulis machinosus]|uniref:ATP-binding protein n=1 Tax=Asticcacaulis machinosus TaxID=2984211 RepID=A0ABT5HFY2_9CAUL|nr:ATP-binding protein [Asticcacaulis machinosus]MDC7675142.1 ATP-binding protein [Asticcacaulis machinosus]
MNGKNEETIADFAALFAAADKEAHTAKVEETSPDLVQDGLRYASVSGWFDPMVIWQRLASQSLGAAPLEWIGSLRRMSFVDPETPNRWMLLDQFRLPELQKLSQAGTLHETAESMAQDVYSKTLARLLSSRVQLAKEDSSTLPVVKDVARWLTEISVPVSLPSAAEITGTLEQNLRDAELERLSRGMVGREDELRALHAFVRQNWSLPPSSLPVFCLEGMGGIGKSTLVAGFIRDRLPLIDPEAIVIWIDYDRLRIRSEDVTTIALDISRQLSWALPHLAEQMAEARTELRRFRPSGLAPSASEVSREYTSERTSSNLTSNILSRHISMQKGKIERPVLLVLDTLEHLERAPVPQHDVVHMLHALRRDALLRMVVIASGRRAFSTGFGGTPVVEPEEHLRELTGLSVEGARAFLQKRETINSENIEKLLKSFEHLDERAFRQTIGVPLILSLLTRLVSEGAVDLTSSDTRSIQDAVNAEAVTQYLYGRVLNHLPDQLARFATAGLLLREVSAEMLKAVVWPVIRMEEYNKHPEPLFDKIFAQLVAETWLVDVVASSTPMRVKHRPDLRRLMLQNLYTSGDTRSQALRINNAALAWHRTQITAATSTELTFHRTGVVYYAVAAATLGGSMRNLRSGELRANGVDLQGLLYDFPEGLRPLVQALMGVFDQPDKIPQLLGQMNSALRSSVIVDLMKGFERRREPVEGLKFAGGLPVEDRGRTPTMARMVLRSFIASGRWHMGVRVAAPLVSDPTLPALNFGSARPYYLPWFAAYLAQDMRGKTIAEELKQHAEGVHSRVNQWYLAFGAIFGRFDNPSKPDDELYDLLMALGSSRKAHRQTTDNLRLIRVLGRLQQRRLFQNRDVSKSDLELVMRRGGYSFLPKSLMKDARDLSAEQVLTLLVEHENEQSDRGYWSADSGAIVKRSEDFVMPLASVLETYLSDQTIAYRLSDYMWRCWPIKPYDLRPSKFSEECSTPRGARQALRTLCSFADHTGQMSRLIDIAQRLTGQDKDIRRIRLFYVKWEAAFG